MNGRRIHSKYRDSKMRPWQKCRRRLDCYRRDLQSRRHRVFWICDACEEIGANLPIYELRGNDLRIYFKALQRAFIDQSKVQKGQNEPLAVDGHMV